MTSTVRPQSLDLPIKIPHLLMRHLAAVANDSSIPVLDRCTRSLMLIHCRCQRNPVRLGGSSPEQYASRWNGEPDEQLQSGAEKPIPVGALQMARPGPRCRTHRLHLSHNAPEPAEALEQYVLEHCAPSLRELLPGSMALEEVYIWKRCMPGDKKLTPNSGLPQA